MKSSFSLHRPREYRVRRQTPNFRLEQQRKKQKQEAPGNATPTNPIQNQFTVLSNQRDTFIRERENAEKELKQIQRDHQSMKKEHHALFESNRRAKQELGQKMERLAILKEEESRLKRLTENEFKAIRDCTKHSNMLEKKRVESSEKYIAELDPINFEIAALLKRRIDKKIERCISLRSVQTVIIPEFQKAVNRMNKPQLLKDFSKSVEVLASASIEHQKCIARLGKLRCIYQRMARAGIFGEVEAHTHKKQRNHVDLFYGPPEDYSPRDDDQSPCSHD